MLSIVSAACFVDYLHEVKWPYCIMFLVSTILSEYRKIPDGTPCLYGSLRYCYQGHF